MEGNEYTNYSNVVVPAVQVGPDCYWKRKCYEKVCEDDRIYVFGNFHNLKSKNEQDIYLQGLIERHEIARKRLRGGAMTSAKEHEYSYKYHLKIPANPEKLQVCKNAFNNFHGITNQRVRRLCNLLKENALPFDKRGQNRSGNSIAGEVCESIEEHIKSFPTKEAHYTSKSVMYLPSNLNIKTMHEMFTTKYPDTKVTYDFYRKIFNERFEL